MDRSAAGFMPLSLKEQNMGFFSLGRELSARARRTALARRQSRIALRSSIRRTVGFQPRLESLEARQLMAADVWASTVEIDAEAELTGKIVAGEIVAGDTFQAPAASGPQHNSSDPEDVNNDGACSPADALVIINQINAQSDVSEYFVDVNGDGARSALDVLMVINRLNNPLAQADLGLGDEDPLDTDANSVGDTSASAIADDSLEENDSFGTARNLGTLTASTTIGPLALADTSDWYRFSTTSTAVSGSTVSIQFTHAAGDLELRLYNSRGMLLRSSLGATNSEQVSISGLPAGTYFARVFGDRGAMNPSYSLRVNLGATVTDDSYEQNDSFAAASDLGTLSAVRTISNLVLADSQDWFRFTTTAAGASGDVVSLGFQNSQGNLALELYNAAGQRVGVSNGATNAESISLATLASGTYYVRVLGSNGATNPNYALTIDPPVVVTPPTTTPATGGFNIEIVYSGLTAAQQAIFEQAAAEWEAVIVGDLANATYNGTAVDDLLINASAVAIDGVGSILGQAGPDRFRSGSQLPIHGIMQFDSADMASMQANGTLLGVIMHEMGHVLGIGTLWASKGLVTGTSGSNPLYVGPQGLAAYNAIAGVTSTGVPVENTGGSGTRNAHWRESTFGSELMTGFVGPGTNMPLSRITVGALADLGYTVNYAAADAYTLPRSSSAIASGSASSSSNAAILEDSSAAAEGIPSNLDENADWSSAVDYFYADLMS